MIQKIWSQTLLTLPLLTTNDCAGFLFLSYAVKMVNLGLLVRGEMVDSPG